MRAERPNILFLVWCLKGLKMPQQDQETNSAFPASRLPTGHRVPGPGPGAAWEYAYPALGASGKRPLLWPPQPAMASPPMWSRQAGMWAWAAMRLTPAKTIRRGEVTQCNQTHRKKQHVGTRWVRAPPLHPFSCTPFHSPGNRRGSGGEVVKGSEVGAGVAGPKPGRDPRVLYACDMDAQAGTFLHGCF